MIHNQRFYILSILISIICFIGIIYENSIIADLYLNASGKTRALFSLLEVSRWYIKVGLGIALLVALGIAFLSFKLKERKRNWRLAILIGLFTFTLLFFRIWKLMI